MRAWLCAVALLLTGCLSGWKSDGPWACEAGNVCPDGFTCDDGVCCKPGGTPACPTLPFENTCPERREAKLYFSDADGDGVGWSESGRPFCRAPQQGGWVELGGDCNDADATVGPRANERCNAQDDDCDGVIDNGLVNLRWFRDADGDGFGGNCATCALDACVQPEGYVARAGDCDDGNADKHPGALELCNNEDDNCNNQVDEAPYRDVENPSDPDTTPRPCNTGRPGECAAGGMQCVYSAALRHFEPTCVPRNPPRTDICGDGLDNDCDGQADQPPGCGGPRELWSSPGVVIGAFVQRDAGLTLKPTPTCGDAQKTESMAWLRPTWVGTGVGEHVLFAEAALPWDLSTAGSLRIEVNTRAVGGANPADGGVAPLWNDDGSTHEAGPRAPSLVIQLCGGDGSSVRRYVPTAATRLASGQMSLVLPLGTAAGWTTETQGAFSLSSVKRVELLVSPRNFVDVTFTNRFAADGGGLGFFP
ncbi:MAG: hypothetical protein DI536_35000 [Archangium gephyra]|uniref:Lipoprotein n=1 Tax=Archangium gephyra TaxID=48 RepID=A0A2W5UL99_9BACT|nr:MAG: hypothetical protein DI536_35000 [Archangium gephyra]